MIWSRLIQNFYFFVQNFDSCKIVSLSDHFVSLSDHFVTLSAHFRITFKSLCDNSRPIFDLHFFTVPFFMNIEAIQISTITKCIKPTNQLSNHSIKSIKEVQSCSYSQNKSQDNGQTNTENIVVKSPSGYLSKYGNPLDKWNAYICTGVLKWLINYSIRISERYGRFAGCSTFMQVVCDFMQWAIYGKTN